MTDQAAAAGVPALGGWRTVTIAVAALGLGGVTAAWFAARLLSRVTDHRLERAIAILLMSIAPAVPPAGAARRSAARRYDRRSRQI